MAKIQSEPKKTDWYKDDDGEVWLHDEGGWRLLDGYGSGGGFEVDNYRTWEDVSMYGPFRKAGKDYVLKELDLARGFSHMAVAQSEGKLKVEPLVGTWHGVGNLFIVREVVGACL